MSNQLARLPYPKPVTLLSKENNKNQKSSKFEAEFNKGIALQISDLRPNTENENDIFPIGEEGEGPDKGENQFEDEGNQFFITENNQEQQEKQGKNAHIPNDSKIIQELQSQESGREDPNLEQQLDNESRNMFDDVDYGQGKISEFKRKALEVLVINKIPDENQVEENNLLQQDYDNALDLPTAYKSLKSIVKNPIIVHSKRPKANYMKPTFSTSRHAIAGKLGEQKFLEFSKISKPSYQMNQDSELSLPPINQNTSQLSDQSQKKRTLKEEKIDMKVDALLEAYRNEKEQKIVHDNSRHNYGFSESDED